jgi:hypothetical protein
MLVLTALHLSIPGTANPATPYHHNTPVLEIVQLAESCFAQQAEQHQRRLRLCSLCRGKLAYAVSVWGNCQPPPTRTNKTSTPKVLPHPFRDCGCCYHKGGKHDSTIVLVLAQVESIGPVLPILDGGCCVCHFVYGLHRLWWRHRVFFWGREVKIYTLPPTSSLLPHASNRPTGITSVGSHDTTNPLSLCYLLAFPSASCAVVALLIVLSYLHTTSTSTEQERSLM